VVTGFSRDFLDQVLGSALAASVFEAYRSLPLTANSGSRSQIRDALADFQLRVVADLLRRVALVKCLPKHSQGYLKS